jgi:hypothetical protein
MTDATKAPLYVTYTEGGNYVPFAEHQAAYRKPENGPGGLTIHSVFFDDGSVFDSIAGWRYGAGPNPDARHLKYSPLAEK